MHRVQHAETKIDGELQPRLARGRLDAVAVLEQQDAEAVESGVLQREAVLGLVHAEAARTAGAGREEDVVVENLLAREPFLLEELEILHQIAHGKVGRVALPVVAEFLAGLEGRNVGHRKLLAAISAALKDGAYQIFMLPGEPSEQNRRMRALLGREGALDGTVKVFGPVEPGNLA